MKSKRCRSGRLARHAALLVALLAVACGQKPLTFTITFKDAKGLEPGQHLVLSGIRIGEVTAVDFGDDDLIHVQVEVDKEHRDKVYREARFRIDRPEPVDASAETQITMEHRDGARTPVEPGDVIEGAEGLMDPAIERMKAFWDAASEGWSQLSEKLEEVASSPEAQALKEDLQRFGERSRELGSRKLEEFRTEQLPKLKERAMDFKRQLEEEGRLEEAEEFWRDFVEWLEGEQQ